MFGWKHWASIGRVSALCKESHLSPLSYHCLHLHYTLTLTIVTIVIVTVVCIYTITILITLIIVIIVLPLFACDLIENKEEKEKKTYFSVMFVCSFLGHMFASYSWIYQQYIITKEPLLTKDQYKDKAVFMQIWFLNCVKYTNWVDYISCIRKLE